MYRKIFLISLVFMKCNFTHAMEIDSFHRRNDKIADSTDILNDEVNKRLKKAVSGTTSCNVEDLYTNVHNQLTSGNSGFGVISGMENWVEASDKIEKIQPPTMEQSIYWGTSFDSVWSVGFWLHVYQAAFDEAKFGVNKMKQAIRWARGYSNDPLVLCNVPDDQKEFAKKFIAMGGRPHPGGPPPPGGFPPGGGPPFGPPEGYGPPGPRNFMSKNAGGPPPEYAEKMRKLFESPTMKCVQEHLGISAKGTAALQVVINLNGSRVGADKVGHFFDTGAEYFREAYSLEGGKFQSKPQGQKAALDWGTKSEEGMFGKSTTGVKSYGDLAANYGGMKFWEALAGTNSPYVTCVDGKFKLQRDFNFRDYANDSWDEGVNCSEYSSKEMTDRVNKNLSNLGMSCPMNIKSCERLTALYSDVADHILSPACKNSVPSIITATGASK